MSAARSMSSRALITTWSSVGTGSVMTFPPTRRHSGSPAPSVSSRDTDGGDALPSVHETEPSAFPHREPGDVGPPDRRRRGAGPDPGAHRLRHADPRGGRS